MPRVFITQETQVDYTKAQQFGDLMPVTAKDLSNVPGSAINRDIVTTIAAKLRHFNPDEDFLLISGSPYVGALCAWQLGRIGIHKFTILRWSNQDRCYYPVEVDSGK
jgi:hypothetical protein